MSIDQIQNQLLQTVGKDPRFSAGPSPTSSAPGPGTLVAGDGDIRHDPRTGARLAKGRIPRGDGTFVTIDYNPSTGGVFLDRGELEDLSKIKEVKTTLEAVLANR